jgi:hypothetical protein
LENVGNRLGSAFRSEGDSMMRLLAALLALLTLALPAHAQVPAYPAAFKTQEIAVNGTTLHVRTGGTGPAVLLLTAMARPATCGRRSPPR